MLTPTQSSLPSRTLSSRSAFCSTAKLVGTSLGPEYHRTMPSSAQNMAPDGHLRVQGTDIIDKAGDRVILKGAATGGHLNCENFISGFPGHEHEMRSAMLEVLGQEKYDFFFDKVLQSILLSSRVSGKYPLSNRCAVS